MSMGLFKLEESLAKLKEEFSGAWALLNDTSRYLKRAGLFSEYEPMLRSWRSSLKRRYKNTDAYKEIKSQIIAIRTDLRKEGHDLRLGNYDLVLIGFKSDDAPRYGFTRAVIYLSRHDIFYVTGKENHIELCSLLEASFGMGRVHNHSYVHNVWFRWKHHVLEVAGADSETKEQYEAMGQFVEKHKLFCLKYLKNMS